MKDVIKLIRERNELTDFLSVPAPDVLHKNAFWHDENDLPIDCNIYHPKYGFPGFETSTSDEKDFTNKDGKKVKKVDWLQTHLKRLAENEQDFETIYQRELASKKLSDTPEIRTVFSKKLINHIQELIELHEKNSNYKDGIDIKVLALANRFIDYIKPLPSQQTETKSEQEQPEPFVIDVKPLPDQLSKPFSEYLLHEKRERLADKIKAEFKTEKGKGIRLLIEALQLNEPQLLNIENRQRTAVFEAMKTYFDRDIGTYNSVFTSYKFDMTNNKPDFEAIKGKVDFILTSIDK